MKLNFLHWSSIIAAWFSAGWVVLLAALVVRCKVADQPFPVLAKFSPFRGHLLAADWMLEGLPILALLAFVLVSISWYHERRFQTIRPLVVTIGVSMSVSLLVIAFNPGGCV